MLCSQYSRDMKKLIEELMSMGYLKTPRIIEAFRKVDRKDFILEDLQHEAYGNYPLPIGDGQTISQPLTVAFMLELLNPAEGDKILEVGAGSGWQTALLAELVGRKGKVVAIERIPKLAKMAQRNLARYKYTQIELVLGDGAEGYDRQAPYDKIIAAASASSIPKAWEKQLKISGIAVFPLGNSIYLITKTKENRFERKEYPGFVFVPLIRDGEEI